MIKKAITWVKNLEKDEFVLFACGVLSGVIIVMAIVGE